MIGDKPRWYSHYLEPLYYQVHNPHSRLGHDLADDSDSDSPPLDEANFEDSYSDSDTSFSDLEEYLGIHSQPSTQEVEKVPPESKQVSRCTNISSYVVFDSLTLA